MNKKLILDNLLLLTQRMKDLHSYNYELSFVITNLSFLFYSFFESLQIKKCGCIKKVNHKVICNHQAFFWPILYYFTVEQFYFAMNVHEIQISQEFFYHGIA